MKTVLLLALTLLAGSCAFATDLSGVIQDDKGKPIPGATVKIYTARMRTGSSPYCPSCWADCAKLTKTNPDGSFTIKNVSDKLVFRLLVLARGYEPNFIPKVDTKNGLVQGQLKSRDLSAFHGNQIISGTVLGPDNKPVAGATVEPEFNQNGLDPLGITDETGSFVLTCPKGIAANYLTVKAEGYAPFRVRHEAGDIASLKINLTRGVVISGRIMDQGKPVPGIGIGIVQTDRSGRNWLGPQEAVTTEDGTFHFYNAPPRMDMAIYGLMNSLSGKGAVPVRLIKTGENETTLPIGDLAIVPAATIKGKFHETDGKPFAPETRISISRDIAWDLQIVDVNPDGSFAATGIPLGEKIDIGVPIDHEIQKVSPGFEIDPLNSRVLGTLSKSLSDFAIDLTWKDEATQRADQETKRMTDIYGAFFAQEKFTPEQVKLFIADQAERLHVIQTAGANGSKSPPPIEQGNAAFQKLITDGFSATVYQDYLKFEDYRNGLIVISWFYQPPKDTWMTDEEREKLAPVVGRLNRENEEQWSKDTAKLSKDQMIARGNQAIDQMQAEGNKLLPEAKHAAFAQDLVEMKKVLAQLAARPDN